LGNQRVIQPTCCVGEARATLGPEIRQLFHWIEILARDSGLEPPILLSQCRSAAEQLAMQFEWDRGNRSGLGARPANPENSRHVPGPSGICWAFDLGNSSDWLEAVGKSVQRSFPGDVTWGGIWLPKDIQHFQVNSHKQWGVVGRMRID